MGLDVIAAHFGKLFLDVVMGLTSNERLDSAACSGGALDMVTQLTGHLLELLLLSKNLQSMLELGCSPTVHAARVGKLFLEVAMGLTSSERLGIAA